MILEPIRRDCYLNQLIACKGNGMVKIVTGIRRCGKSFLLFTLFREHLSSSGVDSRHIIELSLDDRRNSKYQNPDALLDYIDSKLIEDGVMNYVILDEVQLVDDFVSVLLSLQHKRNVDVYVSGSNSRFLSKDVVTEFRGRGYEIRIHPFSFAEFYGVVGGDKQVAWQRYCMYGGLPQTLSFDDDKQKENFLLQLHQMLYMRDLIERNKIRNDDDFRELYWLMASIIGAPCNPNKLSNTYKSEKNVALDSRTIAHYLECMEDSFLLERAMRFDVKGRKYINTLSKYYFEDMGLRNAAMNFRQIEESHIMENVIFNEFRKRGARVDVGCVETWGTNNGKRERRQLEVDFVVNEGKFRYYVQSAIEMPTKEKIEQEKASLRRINDGCKRVIIVRSDMMPYVDEDGFYIIGLFDFLLNPNLLSRSS